MNFCVEYRLVPDTDLAGYPAAGYRAINFAGYRISGEIVNIEFERKKFIEIFSFQQNLLTFLVAISLKKYAHSKFASFVQQFKG